MYSAPQPDLRQRLPMPLDLTLRFGIPFLAAVACGWVGLRLVGAARFALVPISIALLLTALLGPLVRFLHSRLHVRPYLGAALCLLLTVGAVAGILTFVTNLLLDDSERLTTLAQNSLHQTADWLRQGPLHLQDGQLTGAVDKAQEWLTTNSGNLANSAMAFGTSLSEIGAMTVLTLVSAFFLLGDGKAIWRSLLWLVPPRSRGRQYEASRRSWHSLEVYARTAVVVAVIDALGIGLGAAVLKVPFVLPLMMLVFVSAFVPFVGAIVSGALAVVLALFTGGPTTAVLMAAVVLAVQQLEGNVLQPLLMGKAVNLHPYAVIVGVSLSGYLWGLVGALLAVPVMAGAMAWLRYLHGEDPFPQLAHEEPDEQEVEAREPEDGGAHVPHA